MKNGSAHKIPYRPWPADTAGCACSDRTSAASLPRLDTAWDDMKQRVGRGRHDHLESDCPLRIACCELRLQMSPLVLELSARNGQLPSRARWTDKVAVERVAAVQRLFADGPQVRCDRSRGRPLAAKTLNLGMVTVAPCRTPQNGLSQQSLAPQRHKTTRVEVLRVQTPDSHVAASVTDPRHRLGYSDRPRSRARYLVQSSMSNRRRSNRSERAYAASTLFGTRCASAASMTSRGWSAFSAAQPPPPAYRNELCERNFRPDHRPARQHPDRLA